MVALSSKFKQLLNSCCLLYLKVYPEGEEQEFERKDRSHEKFSDRDNSFDSRENQRRGRHKREKTFQRAQGHEETFDTNYQQVRPRGERGNHSESLPRQRGPPSEAEDYQRGGQPVSRTVVRVRGRTREEEEDDDYSPVGDQEEKFRDYQRGPTRDNKGSNIPRRPREYIQEISKVSKRGQNFLFFFPSLFSRKFILKSRSVPCLLVLK